MGIVLYSYEISTQEREREREKWGCLKGLGTEATAVVLAAKNFQGKWKKMAK